MEKKIISTKNAPAAIGPYSQGVVVGNLLFTSGQIPLDPTTGDFVNDDIKSATVRVFENLRGILEEAGTSFDRVVKAVVFVSDMNNFAAVNEVYATYFTENQPARSTVQAARLPKDALVEIEVIALVG